MCFLRYLIALPLLFTQPGFASQRPQEPKSPYPYNEEEVRFENSAAGISLVGTLTLPRSKGPFPAVVILHGSAPVDRDCSYSGHKFFLVWADHLTRQGMAVLRFDKRSVGKSTGDHSLSTVNDFASDALAAIAYLKTRKEINPKQMGLIGHSEGGVTASIAASNSNDVAFIVMMAAPAVNAEKLILLQEAELQRTDGVNEEIISQSLLFRNKVFDLLKKEKNREVAAKRMKEIFENLTPSQRENVEKYYGPADAQIQFFNSVGLRYWVTYDPTSTLRRVNIPILALNGDLDLVVSAEQNLMRIAATLDEMHHTDYTVVLLPKLNHAFQTCQIGSVMEYEQIEETASPLALKIMSEWILERTN